MPFEVWSDFFNVPFLTVERQDKHYLILFKSSHILITFNRNQKRTLKYPPKPNTIHASGQ